MNGRKTKTKVEPIYPAPAKQYHLSGKVRLEVTVPPGGDVIKTHVIGGSPLLAGAALDAVKQSKFEPGPKESVETIDFVFQSASR